MIATLGYSALMIAFAMALLQAASPLLSHVKQDRRYVTFGHYSTVAQALFTSLAFLLLIWAFLISDFQVSTVYLHSHSAKPLLYKFTGTWGNHEGSMLLWATILSVYGAATLLRRIPKDAALESVMLGVHGAIAAGLLLFILATSNPFITLTPIPPEGQGLNPLLQDIGLAIHPPLLYLGYVGFAIIFAYAVAGMITGKMDKDWAATAHPWIMLSWGTLTFGIGFGSWWAYRELGWGGWWFWDPVENVSLMPWLAGTALLHANLSLEKRGLFARWVALLAIFCFGLSLIGTFIVRSGLLVSVHSFASDPERGVFLLLYLAVFVGSALILFARSAFPPSAKSYPLSRDGMILVNNLFLSVATTTILLAILYPVLLQLVGQPSITVGPPYYHQTFFPLTAPLLFLAAVAPFLPWGEGKFTSLLSVLRLPAAVTLLVSILLLTWLDHRHLSLLGSLALAIWLLAATLSHIRKTRRNRGNIKKAVALWCGHGGLALFAMTAAFSSFLHEAYEAPLYPDQPVRLGDVTLEMTAQSVEQKDNYLLRRAQIDLEKDGNYIATLFPEIRFYPVRGMQTSEAAIASRWWGDYYLTISPIQDNQAVGVRFHIRPAMGWLWLSFLCVGGGGLWVAIRRWNAV